MSYQGLYGDFYQKQQWLSSFGLSGNHNYCAVFVSHSLQKAQASYPPRSSFAVDFIRNNSIPARYVARGTYQIQRGDIVVWSKGARHVGIAIESWQHAEGLTIEGNTSPGPYSDLTNRSIRGIFVKQRSASPGHPFRITYVTNVYY